MCTVSLVPSPDGSILRLLMNRDEQRLRPVGQPPVVRRTSLGRALWPTDPTSSGSWITATDAGVALVVMNVDGHRRSPDLLSRGTLIPFLADCRSIDDVVARWKAIDVSAFAPFRLLAIEGDRLMVCVSGDRTPALQRIGRAHVFASSSLGDAKVEPLRRELFAQMLRTEPDRWVAQNRFHQHAWPSRRHLSVMMSRVDACTVSQTEVLLTPSTVALAYRPVVDGWAMAETRRTLPSAIAPWRAA
jgi:Transport and Golgi organisation 2